MPLLNPTRGKCSFCETSDTDLVDPAQLGPQFATLVGIYEPDPAGRLLIEWLRDDWAMFTHPRLDDARAKSLLAEILDDGEIVRQMFSPSDRFQSGGLDRWERLRDELMYRNRYFPDTDIDTDRLKALLDQLKADEVPARWYRARIQTGDAAFPIEEMGAPPKRVASHGRANPPGIQYLYIGSSESVAVSEVRPPKGATLCVAEFELPNDLVMADMQNPRQLISPFVFGDEDAIGGIRNEIPFLERLGEELTRPVLPEGAPIDYVPSQYLCEFIKKCGFDGVIYKSSAGEGVNLALFDHKKATGGAVRQVRVTQVAVEIDWLATING